MSKNVFADMGMSHPEERLNIIRECMKEGCSLRETLKRVRERISELEGEDEKQIID